MTGGHYGPSAPAPSGPAGSGAGPGPGPGAGAQSDDLWRCQVTTGSGRAPTTQECVPCTADDPLRNPDICKSKAECEKVCKNNSQQYVLRSPLRESTQSLQRGMVESAGFGFRPSGGVAAQCACDSGFGWQKQGEHPCGCTTTRASVTTLRTKVPATRPKLASAAPEGPCSFGKCCCPEKLCLTTRPGDFGAITFPLEPWHVYYLQFAWKVHFSMEKTAVPDGYCGLWGKESCNESQRGFALGNYRPWYQNEWNTFIYDDKVVQYKHGPLLYENFREAQEAERSPWRLPDTPLVTGDPPQVTTCNAQDLECIQWIRIKSGCFGDAAVNKGCKSWCCGMVRWNYRTGKIYAMKPVCNDRCFDPPRIVTDPAHGGAVDIEKTMALNWEIYSEAQVPIREMWSSRNPGEHQISRRGESSRRTEICSTITSSWYDDR